MNITGAIIFRKGTWNNQTFSEADLDQIVAAFNASGTAGRVPLKAGHSEDQDGLVGQVSLGWVSKIWRDGGNLKADFVDIPKAFYAAIKDGRFKFTSIELLKNVDYDGKHYPLMLDAVACLGAEIPAVAGVSDLQKLAAGRAMQPERFESRATFALQPETPGLPDGAKETTITVTVENASTSDLQKLASSKLPVELQISSTGAAGQVTAVSISGANLRCTVQAAPALIDAIAAGKYDQAIAVVRRSSTTILTAVRIHGLQVNSIKEFARSYLEAENQRLRQELETLRDSERVDMTRIVENVARQHQRAMFAKIENAVRNKRILPSTRLKFMRAFALDNAQACLRFSMKEVDALIKIADASQITTFLSKRSGAVGEAMDGGDFETPTDKFQRLAKAKVIAGEFKNEFAAMPAVVAENPDLARAMSQALNIGGGQSL